MNAYRRKDIPCLRMVSRTLEGINPTPVTVNNPMMQKRFEGQETHETPEHTVDDLGADFDPEALSIGIVKIYNFSEEKDNGGAPKY